MTAKMLMNFFHNNHLVWFIKIKSPLKLKLAEA